MPPPPPPPPAGNCDYLMSGQQTAPGDPTLPLTHYLDAGCCPEGIIPFYNSQADNCCDDNLAENPFV